MKVASFLTLVTALTACATNPRPVVRLAAVSSLVRAAPNNVGISPDLDMRLDSIVGVAMSQGAAPGVALAVGRYGRLVHLKSYGRIDNTPDSPPVTDSTMFDMASLTKVV